VQIDADGYMKSGNDIVSLVIVCVGRAEEAWITLRFIWADRWGMRTLKARTGICILDGGARLWHCFLTIGETFVERCPLFRTSSSNVIRHYY